MSKKHTVGGLKTRIWKACGTDHIRPVLSHAHIQNGYIYATNAHLLVKQKLETVHGMNVDEVKNLEGKFLHRELLRELEKYEVVRFEKEHIYALKSGVEAKFSYSSEPGKYPNCDAVIPRIEGERSVEAIGFDHNILKNLVSAMTPFIGGHKYSFSGPNKGIIVTGREYDIVDELGMIMPTHID